MTADKLDWQSRAISCGAIMRRGAVLIPALALHKFLLDELTHGTIGIEISYFECLFLEPDGTRPSLALSSSVSDFQSVTEFVDDAERCAQQGLLEAAIGAGKQCYFEVG